MMETKNLEELLKLDKELLDFNLSMQMATHYKQYPNQNHALIRQRAEKELEEIKKGAK